MPILGIVSSGANVAGGAFESIASATGTGSSGTITFSSIPGTYQHLQIRYLGRTNLNAATYIRFNSDTGSNYARHYLYGMGTTVYAGGVATQTTIRIGSDGGTDSTQPQVGIIDIHDYASTTKNKTVRTLEGIDKNGSGDINLNSGLWMSTNAITSISIYTNTGNWDTSSRFALYGIRGA